MDTLIYYVARIIPRSVARCVFANLLAQHCQPPQWERMTVGQLVSEVMKA